MSKLNSSLFGTTKKIIYIRALLFIKCVVHTVHVHVLFLQMFARTFCVYICMNV